MTDTKRSVCFVCSKMSPSDRAIGEPFTGADGRWLYASCLKHLGLKRSEVDLVSLDCDIFQKCDGQIVIAVGRPASRQLGDAATVTIPHPAAIAKSRDSGEVDRKMERVKSLLGATEDAQGVWPTAWQGFVPPAGGKYVYQEHTVGDIVHYDLRMTSTSDGRLWGWTMPYELGEYEEQTTPKELHPSDWLTMDGPVPGGGGTMKILASGSYTTGVCHDSLCELMLEGLTNEIQSTRVAVTSTGSNGSGVKQWVSQISAEQAPLRERATLAEITSGLNPEEKVIYDGRLVSAGSVQEKRLVRISKQHAAESKHIVYGVVLDPCIVDAHNDWNPPEDIEDQAHDYLEKSRKIKTMHEKNDDASRVVESWVEQYPTHEDYLAAMAGEDHRVTARKFGNDTIHSGTWMLGMRLGDEAWAQYKSGKLNAFSPGGFGRREKISRRDMPKIEVINAA